MLPRTDEHDQPVYCDTGTESGLSREESGRTLHHCHPSSHAGGHTPDCTAHVAPQTGTGTMGEGEGQPLAQSRT